MPGIMRLPRSLTRSSTFGSRHLMAKPARLQAMTRQTNCATPAAATPHASAWAGVSVIGVRPSRAAIRQILRMMGAPAAAA